MKKISLVLGVLLLCVFAFTGCSGRENKISTQIPEFKNVHIGGYYDGSIVKLWELDPAYFEDLRTWIEQLSISKKTLDEDESPNNWAGGNSYEFNINEGELCFTYSIGGEGGNKGYIWYNDEWYEITNPTTPPVENKKEIAYDKIPMVMVNGKLYYDTGSESTIEGRCGTMDGEISSTVDGSQVPTEDNQSNFGVGYGYQYGQNNTIEVYINDKWIVFEHRSGNGNTIRFGDIWYNEADLSEETIEWLIWYSSLSEEEQLSISGVPPELIKESELAEAQDTETPIKIGPVRNFL
jgi:hypothetical protein